MSEFRPIIGWEGFYEINNIGDVISLYRGKRKIRAQRFDKDGYKLITLKCKARQQTIKVHREVMAAFIGPCPAGFEVNHKNLIRHDNRIENLEYSTKSSNQLHAWANGRPRSVSPFTKLNDDLARIIKAEYLATRALTATAKKYGMSRNAVWLLGTGKTWAHL